MTVVYFVEKTALRSSVLLNAQGIQIDRMPIGVTAAGELVDGSGGSNPDVIVAFVDDLAVIADDYQIPMKLSPPVIAVVHRPGVQDQISWLSKMHAVTVGTILSHVPENPAYAQVIAILTAQTKEDRQQECLRIVNSYATDSLIISLEKLAAWVFLNNTKEAHVIYEEIQSLLPAPARNELKQKEGMNSGSLKLAAELTVSDIESAAAHLIP